MYYNIGDIVQILDHIDLETITTAVIKMIEPDEDDENLFWLYLSANNDILNNKYEPKYGFVYWDIINSDSEYIKIISRATYD